jgi:hypothetical protein
MDTPQDLTQKRTQSTFYTISWMLIFHGKLYNVTSWDIGRSKYGTTQNGTHIADITKRSVGRQNFFVEQQLMCSQYERTVNILG